MKYKHIIIIIALFIIYSCSVTRQQNCNCSKKENWEKCIEGKWESKEDANFTLSFKKGKVIWAYKYESGEIESEVYDYFFSSSSCDLEYLNKNTSDNIFISYISTKDTLCYEITAFSTNQFTYIWTNRPNIQSFNKIFSRK